MKIRIFAHLFMLEIHETEATHSTVFDYFPWLFY